MVKFEHYSQASIATENAAQSTISKIRLTVNQQIENFIGSDTNWLDDQVHLEDNTTQGDWQNESNLKSTMNEVKIKGDTQLNWIADRRDFVVSSRDHQLNTIEHRFQLMD